MSKTALSLALLSCFLAAVLAGCAGGDGRPPTAQAGELTVHDSAGVEIVEMAGSWLESLPVWRIASEPALSLGEVEGDEAYLFAAISRTGVTPLPDGTLAVVDGAANRGSREIRVFDAEGRLVRRMGRAGDGPGEFGSVPSIRPHVDGGLLALETTGRRVTHFGDDGQVVDTWRIDNAPCPTTPCLIRGVLGDGTVLVHASERPLQVTQAMVGQTLDDLRAFYGVITRDGYREILARTLPPFHVLSRETTPMTTESGMTVQLTPVMAVTPILSPPSETLIAAGQRHFVLASHEPLEFRIFEASGTLRTIVRIQRPPVPLTPAEQRTMLESVPVAGRFDGQRVLDHRPQFGYVRFGDGDDLWVADYRSTLLDGEDALERVTIFSVDGRPVARLEIPAGPLYRDQRRSVLHEAPSGRDHFRVVTADELGVERLLVFPVVR